MQFCNRRLIGYFRLCTMWRMITLNGLDSVPSLYRTCISTLQISQPLILVKLITELQQSSPTLQIKPLRAELKQRLSDKMKLPPSPPVDAVK